MIYFDNAATTMKKPQVVVDAVVDAMTSMGNAGRGSHEASLGASRIIFATRQKLNDLFHGENPGQIVFTANSTESLNIAIKGILNPGDHVITTELEHNSVLRPLYEMEARGVELSFVKSDKSGCICYEDFEKLIREDTKAVICTHGSNLTGNLVDIGQVGEIAKRHDLLFIVDASQTAGVFPIDVQKMHIDILCFTGHKSLLGPQGTGGMYVRPGLTVKPLLSGGSGILTYSKFHPKEMPTVLEAGTLNAHGIAGLSAALDYIRETGMDRIRAKEHELMQHFYEGVRKIPGVTVYGDFKIHDGCVGHGDITWRKNSEDSETVTIEARCPIVTLNLWDYDSSEVSDALFMEYGISTRPGAHCAPLMHQALGTVDKGAVRFSFSHFNTMEEINETIEALKELAKIE